MVGRSFQPVYAVVLEGITAFRSCAATRGIELEWLCIFNLSEKICSVALQGWRVVAQRSRRVGATD